MAPGRATWLPGIMSTYRRLRRIAGRAVPRSARRRARYRRQFGRDLPRGRPDTFTDKVNWRLLHDRRALLEGTCDKLAMKEHALRVAPDLVRVPRTLWCGTDVAELAGVDLPEHWVLKPNHGTRRVHFGHGRPDVAELARTTRGWVEQDLWREDGEWAYRSARHLLVAEEFIGVPGTAPDDLKVFVFDGFPRLVQVHTARFDGHSKRVYTPEWEPKDWSTGRALGPLAPRPRRLDDMLRAASALAAGFDMLRVDFYEHDGVLWFGELTPYPGSGVLRLDPEMDELMGRWWTLPARPRGGERIVLAGAGAASG